ncbi:ModE molybdate transport repressor domain-containing protein [Streptoalloteichus tenebrarius]|uniref:ModE molybdate transport repressor domain-containing protein n=1 Tax=Streptoalloteichus tenebrarius (strain ATCC 17920 / DSM 40477 / JCM 4838 / CBS 697.72 / NBRC 16177 / NCIMB 11028 / NRRL B-12390 / A12253. 1 / ISP 5477) TaxID=1933 RepID=A0ABT1HQH5_STRSD|nr:LysR family transcriptional regulator [Streptoalloteichus tenebrarius]MCP2257753.1 ModE molybdate transport repressor domain-containing protein [Streptoalloteichus tenebrarius]BFE99888.1 LysR family transcriptional regulator [Streptoalloteichus tenebrarius]
MLELRHLRVLREISRTGSYSAAARNLGYTQPAISQQMKALERAYGTPLVVRTGRRIAFTEAGRELVRHARTILSSVAAAEATLTALANLRSGTVRLVSFPSGSASLVPGTAATMRRRHPGVRLSLTEAEPPESVRMVREGECDLALTFSYPEDDDDAVDLVRIPLVSDPLVALLPGGHPLAEQTVVRLTDLAGESWIAGCPRCSQHLVQVCGETGFTPDIAFSTDDNLAVQSLVAKGLGVAASPGLVLSCVRRTDLAVRPLEPTTYREIAVVTWPDHVRVPAIRATIDALREAARAARAHGPWYDEFTASASSAVAGSQAPGVAEAAEVTELSEVDE